MMSLVRTRSILLISATLLGCAGPAPEPDAEPTAPAGGKSDVWVFDSRLDWNELDQLMQADERYDVDGAYRAASSVAAVTTRERVESWDDLQGTPSTVQRVCEDENYAEQPAFRSTSTAVLVEPDLVLTAWHSVRRTDCEDLRFVFGYRIEDSEDVAPIDRERDSYACASIVLPATFEEGEADYDDDVDLALVRLDRPVDPRYQVATVAAQPRLAERPTRILAVGHPLGMPLKADPSFLLGDVGETNLFEVGSDLFGGNSGGPFFDLNNELIGVVKGGPRDFEWDRDRECARYAVHGVDTNKGSWAAPILQQYCDEIDASAAWCGDLEPG